jgi:hypothetical protein
MQSFPAHSFQFVVDKGTFDAIVCASDSELHIEQMLYQIDRLLQPNGVYVMLSHGNPVSRLRFFQRVPGWCFAYRCVAVPAKANSWYLYAARRTQTPATHGHAWRSLCPSCWIPSSIKDDMTSDKQQGPDCMSFSASSNAASITFHNLVSRASKTSSPHQRQQNHRHHQ